MPMAKQRSFANNYLQSRVEDNYSRFIVSTYVLCIIGILFTFRNIYYQLNGINGIYKDYYLAIWMSLIVFSIAFRFVLSAAKKRQSLIRLDMNMMFYASIICIVGASISALQSLISPNFTAFSFLVLGTATAYRAPAQKYLIIMSLALAQFSLVYFIYFEQPFSVLFLLPPVAICAMSFLIANSLEQNRKHTLELSIDLKATNERLKSESIQDPLTKLYNRRYLADFLSREVKEFARYREPFCVAVCDLDHFKKINDSLGHLTGDKALMTTAKLLQESSRATDIVVRFGGEEFVIVMPRTSLSFAYTVVERMREKIQNHSFTDIPWPLTASIGLTMINAEDTDDSLLARADELLYQAKEGGRNQTVANLPDIYPRPVAEQAS